MVLALEEWFGQVNPPQVRGLCAGVQSTTVSVPTTVLTIFKLHLRWMALQQLALSLQASMTLFIDEEPVITDVGEVDGFTAAMSLPNLTSGCSSCHRRFGSDRQ